MLTVCGCSVGGYSYTYAYTYLCGRPIGDRLVLFFKICCGFAPRPQASGGAGALGATTWYLFNAARLPLGTRHTQSGSVHIYASASAELSQVIMSLQTLGPACNRPWDDI